MLSIVLLSASTAFAAEDADIIAADDEIAIDDDALAVADEPTISANESAAAKAVVTKDTFKNYFDDSGSILSNVTADELTFEGDIADVGVNTIVVDRAIKLTGEATLSNIAIDVKAKDVAISGLTLNQDNAAAAISVSNASDVQIENVKINFKAIDGADGYAINADLADNLKLLNNVITYTGTTTGYGINNGLRVSNSNSAEIKGNKFTLDLVSAPVGWAEVPSGSGNWVSSPVSEGVVIDSSKAAVFEGNVVELKCINATGSYDTIYTVDVKNSDDAIISANNITANGHTYIYGLIISGQNFQIANNTINSASDIYYANGIDIEGPASGIVDSNMIKVKAVSSAYPIYSGMNGQNVSANYTNNILIGDAYLVLGMSLGDVESSIEDNLIALTGNYTTGIASRVAKLNVAKNNIALTSSEQGNESIGEAFGVEAVGIKVVAGEATIASNNITTPGKGLSLTGDKVLVYKNDIDVVANDDADAYAIYAFDIPYLDIIENEVTYFGATAGTGINNGVFVTNATGALLYGNTFDLNLTSCYVPWFEVPSGSDNWVSSPVSEGIVIDTSKDVLLDSNTINVNYNNVFGFYDTIYAVDVKDSDNAIVSNNKIDAKGHTYIYGLIITGNDFQILNNTIKTESDNYYANGIDIEGPATGVVENNFINVKGVASAYPVYSGMNKQSVSANYTNNILIGEAYLVIGMSLGDVESSIEDNLIALTGNYTTGIASKVAKLNVAKNNIALTSSEQGNETMWEDFGVEAVGIKVVAGVADIESNNITTPGKGLSLTGEKITVYQNNIEVTANDDADAYAIYAFDVPDLDIIENNVAYKGATNGTGINNAVFVTNSTTASLSGNIFDLELVSLDVPWAEVPAGSGNWVSSPISEGIVIDSSKDAVFDSNAVYVEYSGFDGMYDTIYAVHIENSDDAVIADNEIDANGHTYIYGMLISGQNFLISNNTIYSKSDSYYANGIDIEGPATGVVESNHITTIAPTSAYPIYAAMSNGEVSVNYTSNDIIGDAYFVLGMSLGGIEANVNNNTIVLAGNYTTGIASKVPNTVVDGNKINLLASNVGSQYVWESFGVQTVGVKVTNGTSTVTNNNVLTSGEYSVNVTDTNSSVHDNYLLTASLKGDSSVNATGDAEIYNNTPYLKSVISAVDVNMVYGDGTMFAVVVKDENNNPIANGTVTVIADLMKLPDAVTDDNGVALFDLSVLDVGSHSVTAAFGEDTIYTISDTSNTINVAAKIVDPGMTVNAPIIANVGDNITVTVALPEDATGNVTVTFDGNEYVVPVENGTATVVLEKVLIGEYSIDVKYGGDDKYLAAESSSPLIVSLAKKDTVIVVDATFTRVANDYNAGERGAFFYAILKDSEGNPLTNKVVQIAVNGPIYNVTTDEKGQAGLQVNLAQANTYTYALAFQGDDEYNAAPLASSKLTVTLKKTSISASSKSFKAKAKTKSVTVTLKTTKNPYDGKTYLKSGKKLTMKVNGKTYTAKANGKGVAKFNIKIAKKGKYTAKISFAGDKTYAGCNKAIKITIK